MARKARTTSKRREASAARQKSRRQPTGAVRQGTQHSDAKGAGRRSAGPAAGARAGAARPGEKPRRIGKVGSNRAAADAEGGKLDFGVPAAEVRRPLPKGGRTKGPQKGSGPQRAVGFGRRTVGVGTAVGPDGSGSGGDADPDLIGVGTPGGSTVSESGTRNRRKGPDDVQSSVSDTFASGPRTHHGRKRAPQSVGGSRSVKGTTRNAAEGTTEAGGGTGTGIAGNAQQAARNDRTMNPLRGGPARKVNRENES